MVSPSKKFCVCLVFRPIELELHVGVSFCLLREPVFYQPVFKSSLKGVGEYVFLHRMSGSGCSYFCISWDEREKSCPVLCHEEGSAGFM